jgi:hypothetical protein
MNRERAYDGRLIFDHRPKTAGQAVNAWLTEHLGSGCVSPNLSNGEHRSLIRRWGGEYSIISGHITYEGGGLDPRYRYVTLFREPVDRALSWLYFLAEHHDEKLLGNLWREAVQFLESDGDELGEQLEGSLANPYVEHFSKVLSFGVQDQKSKFVAARDALAMYDLVGIYEDLPVFIRDFGSLVGVRPDVELAKVNVTKKRLAVSAVSPRMAQRLADITSLDADLYRWACHRHSNPGAGLHMVQPQWIPYWGTGEFEPNISPEFELIFASLRGPASVSRGDLLEFTVDFALHNPLPELVGGLHIYDSYSQRAFGTNTGKILHVGKGRHRIQYVVAADLPPGEYWVAFNFFEPTDSGNRQLAWCPRQLSFRVPTPRSPISVGYADLSAIASVRHIGSDPSGPITDARGTMALLAPFGQVAAGEEFSMPFRLDNASAQRWATSTALPLNLSYRWLDDAGDVSSEPAKRTPLPFPDLDANSSDQVAVQFKAPATAGHYRLLVLPVQEGAAWFDSLGFVPASIDVTVVGSEAPRRYAAADSRFELSRGERRGYSVVSAGKAGFLLQGPRVHLVRGRYVARVRGHFAGSLGQAWAEALYDDTNVMARFEFAGSGSDVEGFDLHFQLERPIANMSIRIWVSPRTVCRVDTVEIERAPEPSSASIRNAGSE